MFFRLYSFWNLRPLSHCMTILRPLIAFFSFCPTTIKFWGTLWQLTYHTGTKSYFSVNFDEHPSSWTRCIPVIAAQTAANCNGTNWHLASYLAYFNSAAKILCKIQQNKSICVWSFAVFVGRTNTSNTDENGDDVAGSEWHKNGRSRVQERSAPGQYVCWSNSVHCNASLLQRPAGDCTQLLSVMFINTCARCGLNWKNVWSQSRLKSHCSRVSTRVN